MAFAPPFQRPFSPILDRRAAPAAAGNGLLNALIAYWPLNEAAGANNALDLHTNGLTLTQTASPGSAAGKVYAGARTFDGSTQYFSRASESLLQTGDVDFTLAAWCYLSDLTVVANQIIKKGNEFAFYYRGSGSGGPSKYRCLVRNTYWVDDIVTPTINTWQFVVAWHDSIANTVSIQLNLGTITSASVAVGPTAGTEQLLLGAEGPPITSLWSGRIGPVAMWKSAAGGGGVLSSSQRSALYNGGAGLPYASFTA